MTVVVDASAILAVVFEENGADIVLAHAQNSLLSAVNLDEVLHKTARRGIAGADIERALARLQIIVRPYDTICARVSAGLHPAAHRHGMSFADRACLSLALVVQRPVLTADTEWPALALDLDIRLIR